MIDLNWQEEGGGGEEIDPGRDIFALLFLSFFLINAVILVCVSNPGGTRVATNTAGQASTVMEADRLGRLLLKEGKFEIHQAGKIFHLPEDLERFSTDGRIDVTRETDGQETRVAVFEDPGKGMSGGEMLKAIQMLNDAGIGAEFRPVVRR